MPDEDDEPDDGGALVREPRRPRPSPMSARATEPEPEMVGVDG